MDNTDIVGHLRIETFAMASVTIAFGQSTVILMPADGSFVSIRHYIQYESYLIQNRKYLCVSCP